MSPCDSPRTSVVVPARNADKTLAETLDSLLAQSDSDWEALIIDDGSTDETAEIITRYSQRDGRLSGLQGSGAGASAARNIGIARASGRRVLFLDSDDWIDPSFLKRMNRAMDAAPDAVAAYCGYRRVMPDGQRSPARSEPQLAQTPFEMFARSCATAIHAVLIERALIVRIGGFDTSLRTCEDWDLWQRAARMGGRWTHVDAPLSYYRASEHSLTQDIDQMLADAAIVIARGFSADERLAGANPAHPHGASTAQGITAELAYAYFALWCGAFDCGRGGTGSPALAKLDKLPPSPDRASWIVGTLLDGLTVGLRVVPAQLAARWAEFGAAVTALIAELDRLWNDPVAARRIQYGFERLVLDYDGLAAPRPLFLTLGLRVNLRDPQPVTPPAGVDRLYVYLCDGRDVRARIDLGVLGMITTRHWLELAVSRLGIRQVAMRTIPSLRRSLTMPKLGHVLRRAGRTRTGTRRSGWRRILAEATRDALLNASGPSRPAHSHQEHVYRLQMEADQSAARRVSTIEPQTVTAEIDGARHIVWGGAVAQSADLAMTKRRAQVPVLLYHRIADDGPVGLARYRLSIEMFRAQMMWLRRNGYYTISSEELTWFLANNHPFAGRPVMISFDDGFQDFADQAWPILRMNDFRAEVFVVTDAVGRSAQWDAQLGEPAPLMDAPTIVRLASAGVSFGSHLASHRAADGLPTGELAGELTRSRATLRQWLDRPVCAFAAPFGLTDERLRILAAECGYRTGFGTEPGVVRLTSDPLNLPRIEIRGDSTLEDFIACLEACR